MDKGKIEECLTSLLDSMVTAERSESQKLIKDALEKLNQSGFKVSNPEHFNLCLVYKLNKGVKEIANTMHDAPADGIKDTCKPNFIYLHYDFLEHNIRELCVLREGSSCCADKSRAVIKMYLNYSLTAKVPEFNPDIERYWIPKFGTYQEWIDLCEGLYSLYYGNTQQYFKSYNALIQSEIRRYKHILHTWYIKFTDGEVIKFSHTWDDKQENPLNDECFDKGDFYLVLKNYVKNRNYAISNDDKYYCIVPKNDIDEIYKVSEEKMV